MIRYYFSLLYLSESALMKILLLMTALEMKMSVCVNASPKKFSREIPFFMTSFLFFSLFLFSF